MGTCVVLVGATITGCSGGDGDSATSVSTSPARSSTVQVKPEILSVPSIDLSTGLKPEGLRGGQIDPAPGEVIWFTGSDRVTPGHRGTAVVAGHVANGSKPDVFAKLGSLHRGGRFDVTMSDGSVATFTVTRAEVVDKQALRRDQQVWGANASSARVVLVTCDDTLGFGADGHRKANYVVVGEKK